MRRSSLALTVAFSLVMIASFPGLNYAQDFGDLVQGKLDLDGQTATIQDVTTPSKSTSATVDLDLLEVLKTAAGRNVGLWIKSGKALAVDGSNAGAAPVPLVSLTDGTPGEAIEKIEPGARFKILRQIETEGASQRGRYYETRASNDHEAWVFAKNVTVGAEIPGAKVFSFVGVVEAKWAEVTLDPNVSAGPKKPLYVVTNEPFRALLAKRSGAAVSVKARTVQVPAVAGAPVSIEVLSAEGKLEDAPTGRRPTSAIPLRDDFGHVLVENGKPVTIGPLETFEITDTKKIGLGGWRWQEVYLAVTTRDGHKGFISQSFGALAPIFFNEAVAGMVDGLKRP
jgi:hypothetical protein